MPHLLPLWGGWEGSFNRIKTMNKLYFQPACMVVELDNEQMVADSGPNIGVNPGTDPIPGEELDAKENKSIWDEEW
jgi:hypothetical protein